MTKKRKTDNPSTQTSKAIKTSQNHTAADPEIALINLPDGIHSAGPENFVQNQNLAALGLDADIKLCDRCATLDMDETFRSWPKRRGKLVTELQHKPRTNSVINCALCRFFISMASNCTGADDDQLKYGVFAFSAQFIPPFKRLTHEVFLGVLPLNYSNEITTREAVQTMLGSVGFISRENVSWASKFQVRLLRDDQIDFSVLINWLDFCAAFHTKFCGKVPKSPIQHLKVIDCTNKKIVPAPEDCCYLTLSYLWGPSPDNCELLSDDSLPTNLPATIADAITVTLRLGYRYLWVDRYCIDQSNKTDKHDQIRQMDLIYQSSEATIVAVAGEDPSYGLPGVGQRLQIPQPHIKIKDSILASTLSDPREAVKSSKWMTRGWTYQEALLSKRRLFFTDQQVYYECYGMQCFEAIECELLDLHVYSGQRFKAIHTGIFPSQGVGKLPFDMLKRISEYSTRSLSFHSDALNGILGVLRAFEDIEYPISHYAGVPIFSTYTKSVGGGALDGNRKSDQGLAVGMCWTLETPGERRPGFPSWSWTGWIGKVFPHAPEYEVDTMGENPKIRIEVELANGERMKWKRFWRSPIWRGNPSDVSRFLYIEAHTMSITFHRSSPENGPLQSCSCRQRSISDTFAVLETKDGLGCYGHWIPTLNVEGISGIGNFYTRKFIGISLSGLDFQGNLPPFVMVVNYSEGAFERIGSVYPCLQSCYAKIPLQICTIRLG